MNVDNQLEEVKLNGNPIVSYVYDSGSRLIQRVENGTTTNYTWDGWDLIREEKTGTITETTKYLVPEGEVLAFERDGQMYYLHGDALSSTQLVTDENGDQVARFVYGAWGEELHATDIVPGGTDVRFVGGLGCRTDPVTGLVYMRYRWYDVEEQRFISRDPIGLRGETNAYRYCLNRPTDVIDPMGLTSITGIAWAFGKGALWGAGTAVVGAGLVAFGGAIGTGIVITAAVAGVGLLVADFAKRVFTGHTPEEGAELIGGLAVGGAVARGLQGPVSGILAARNNPRPVPPDPARLSESPQTRTLKVNDPCAPSRPPSRPGLGDLSAGEIAKIQRAVNRNGHPLTVIGSAARGTRGPLSDVDYVVSRLSAEGFRNSNLPGPAQVIPTNTPLDTWPGPSIIFRPNQAPVLLD